MRAANLFLLCAAVLPLPLSNCSSSSGGREGEEARRSLNCARTGEDSAAADAKPTVSAVGNEEDRCTICTSLFKKAADDISLLPRLERDIYIASADAPERKVTSVLPDVTLKELLLAFHGVLKRAEMFSNLHFQREPLSVRQRMSEILSRVKANTFSAFADL